MADVSPTRSAVLELKEERYAMHEGHVFLDEKCLLLAGEILHELVSHEPARRDLVAAHGAAQRALQSAVARNGLEGLQAYPASDLAAMQLQTTRRALMGVALQQASLTGSPHAPAPAADRSPEAEGCREAFLRLAGCAVTLAAHACNLERLSLEYRRSIRRARALQDVLLPESDAAIVEVETRLEELEQEDAVWMRIDSIRRPR